MARKTTHTMNPLPFEHLEPHRFEDLVRQLIYDFRPWSTIEDTGKSGDDDGMDIRAFEPVTDDDDENDNETKPLDRVWIVQCKREKTITPKALLKYLDESIPPGVEPPYGFIVAAACVFSKKSRDTFRSSMINRGVKEFYLWGRADIEDMLVLPKNDHLLFGYFGISLQVRRRTRRADLRSQLAMKAKVLATLEQDPLVHRPVLVRDASEDLFYTSLDVERLVESKKMVFLKYVGLNPYRPNCFRFIFRKFMAYLDDDRRGWDFMKFNMLDARLAMVRGSTKGDTNPEKARAREFWKDVPQNNKFWCYLFIDLRCDRVIAVDEAGDSLFDGPHLYAEAKPTIFEKMSLPEFERESGYERRYVPSPSDRIEYFPKEFRFNPSPSAVPAAAVPTSPPPE